MQVYIHGNKDSIRSIHGDRQKEPWLFHLFWNDGKVEGSRFSVRVLRNAGGVAHQADLFLALTAVMQLDIKPQANEKLFHYTFNI